MTKALTFAEARARRQERGLLIAPERNRPVFGVGDKALFVEDGRADRVTVASPEWLDPDSGEPMRTCVFHGQGEYDVKAGRLTPIATDPAPIALRSGRVLGLPAIVTDQGRLYQPDPYRERPKQHPVMDKFDRVSAAKPPPLQLDQRTMTDDQARLLARADEALASANRRRMARCHGRTYGRITAQERDERRFAMEAYAELGLGTMDKRDSDEVKRGRAESFALAEARGRAERRDAAKAARAQYAEHKRPYCWHSPRRRDAIARELRELRWTLLEGARAAASKDLQVGGRRMTRDGLDYLQLSPIERASALWYRALYERTERGARVANMEGRVGGGREDTRAASEWGADQIARKQVEARIMSIAKGNGRMITTLRLVAGEGRTISAISGGSGSNRKLNTEALFRALDIVADYRGTQ